MARWYGLLVLAWLVCLSPGSSWAAQDGVADDPAEDGSADDETRARDLFNEGRDAMARSEYRLACQKFEESVRLFRRASMLLNLGACNEKLGKLATSLRYWQEGLGALEITDPRYETAKEEIARLMERTPSLQVRLPENLPPRSTFALDGQSIPIASLTEPLRVDPGTHTLTLDATTYKQTREQVTVEEGDRIEVSFELGDPLKRGVVTVVEAGETQVILGWVLGGVGAAGIVMGAITGGLALDRKATVEEHCSDDVCTDQAGIDAAEEGRTLAILSTVGFAAGAALVGVGLVLILTADTPGDVAVVVSPTGLAVQAKF